MPYPAIMGRILRKRSCKTGCDVLATGAQRRMNDHNGTTNQPFQRLNTINPHPSSIHLQSRAPEGTRYPCGVSALVVSSVAIFYYSSDDYLLEN